MLYKRSLKLHQGLIDLASNDYLGLGTGSTGSRLLTGNSLLAEQLETEIAQFHGFEAGLLFNTGYMANQGLIATVAKENDLILFDSHIHASTRSGIALSKAVAFPFRHNDLAHLERRLAKNHYQSCYICVESVYSMDGSIAPLKEFVNLCKRYRAHLIVDEAHAVGVMGPQGRGVVAELRLEDSVFALVVTFGKALGVMGAAVLGCKMLKELLINFCSTFIYTTALPPSILKMIQTSYRTLPTLDLARNDLQANIQTFRQLFESDSITPIQAIKIGNVPAAKALEQRCQEAGFDVRALTSPTVRQGHEILRICLHAFNTQDQIKSLKEILQ